MKPNASLLAYYRPFGRIDTAAEYNPYVDSGDRDAQARINHMRPWHTVDFGGQPLVDFFNAQAIESAIRLINADSSRAGGVRIRFRAGTTYANLVKVLDMMNYTNQKKYWLDNRHQPATFYAITLRPPTLAERRQNSAMFLGMIDKSADFTYVFPPQTFSQQLKQLNSPWRRPQVLLASAVGALLLALLTATLIAARLAIR
ncbi:hypothetical protein HHL22_09790 [Hymenobacter sp. RP-2-7]|uniref:Uncharacterized protein n=1 Tax=Hymenobacter polaris TaxID=2682546 RepID=A0A7Y0ADS3_9BACT|nr:hypothetical protein [Hymenobacter polaris]NML65494.1 hypothetical protein [Hymenobacter polaris]